MADLAACDLLRLLRRGEASAQEVTRHYVARIEAVNPRLNAVIARRYEEALAEARALDRALARRETAGRLHGLPITVKECLDVRGMFTTGGVVGAARTPKGRDAAVVRLLRAEGAVVLGKTNTAQLNWGHETDNPLFGRTNNPCDLARTPGGSSGGEAAIVAAGGSAIGVGTDSGGSIRIPAHYCGIHGFKPTSGRVAATGSLDTRMLSFQAIVSNQPGLLARRVRDLELAYRVLAGPGLQRPGDAPPEQAGPGCAASFAGWRVGYYVRLGSARTAPAVAAAVLDSVKVLADMGAEAVEFAPPGAAQAAALFRDVFAVDGGAMLRKLLGGSPRSRDVTEALRNTSAGAWTADQVGDLAAACDRYRRRFWAAFQARGLTVIVCPPAAAPAPLHGMGATVSADSAALYNLLGMPAGVVAVSRDATLPVGVQVAAPPWHEGRVLRAMAALELASTTR